MRSLLLAGVALLLAAPALAAPGGREREALKRYCAADATAFCSDTDPGSRAMTACFKRNMRELSPGCRRAISAYKNG